MVSSLTHQKHLSSILLEHNDLADLERLLVEQMNWAKKVGITMSFSSSYKWYLNFNKFGVFLLKEGLGLGGGIGKLLQKNSTCEIFELANQ